MVRREDTEFNHFNHSHVSSYTYKYMEHFIVYVAVMKVDPVCNLQTLGFCSRHWIL